MKTLLAGNIVLDHVSCSRGKKKFYRLGGIINVARAFSFLGEKKFTLQGRVGDGIPTLDIQEEIRREFSDTSIAKNGKMSQAEIIVEPDGKTKESKVIWEPEKLPFPVGRYDWIHLSYLNKLDMNPLYITKIRALCNTLSGDICAGGEKNWQALSGEFDYIFMADDEETPDSTPRKANVIHSRDKVSYIGHKEIFDIPVKSIHNDVVILGAGDYFAAAFIHSSLDKVSAEKACSIAVEKTPKLLKSLNAI